MLPGQTGKKSKERLDPIPANLSLVAAFEGVGGQSLEVSSPVGTRKHYSEVWSRARRNPSRVPNRAVTSLRGGRSCSGSVPHHSERRSGPPIRPDLRRPPGCPTSRYRPRSVRFVEILLTRARQDSQRISRSRCSRMSPMFWTSLVACPRNESLLTRGGSRCCGDERRGR